MSTLIIPPVKPSPREDAAQLHRAFKGLGCDVGIVVNILAHRTASQLEDIQQEFETMYSGDLKKILSSELHGHVKKAVVLWMQNPIDRDVATLRHALTGPINDMKAATEIICTRNSSNIRQIKQVYANTFGTHLDYDIEAHASSDHKKFLLAYINTTRYEGPEIDELMVENDAKVISRIGEKKSGVDEKDLIHIFTERSKAHVVALDSLYYKMFGKEIRTVIKKEISGNLKFGLMTILECANNPAKYFARVLHKAMKGLGTRDTALIRIIVTRAEIDMQQIKKEYYKRYRKSLTDAIHSETSGHYRAFLLALLGSDGSS